MRNTTVSGFYLRLVPSSKDDERKAWDFKCDTLDELNDWSHAFSDAIELANMESSVGGGRNSNDDNNHTSKKDENDNDGHFQMLSGNGVSRTTGNGGNTRSRGFVNIS